MIGLIMNRPEDFRSLQLVRSPKRTRRAARIATVLLLLTAGAMAWLPWRQNAPGTGRVVAYYPTERPQTIESPMYGRIIRWGENIVEGAHVKKGQFILEIQDNDALRSERLDAQVMALKQKADFARQKADTYSAQAEELTFAREMIIQSGQELVEMARRKLDAEKQSLEAAKASEWQLELDEKRQTQLEKEGYVAGVKAQEAKSKHEQAVAKRRAAEEYVRAAENELKSKIADLETKRREAQTKIQYAEAHQREAQGDVAVATKDLVETEGKQAQFSRRAVLAPRDGVILRLWANEGAEMLKEGDPLFTIVPETDERAVELWVDGNDIPLVTVGREVRLQFEGWPALQFSGWPQVAVGTFGAKVVAMDATDDGRGKFRVLVRPENARDWPAAQYLRQGSRANGWVLLNEVALGYEIWRQLNGFPPVYGDDGGKSSDKKGDGKDDKDVKKVKLPK